MLMGLFEYDYKHCKEEIIELLCRESVSIGDVVSFLKGVIGGYQDTYTDAYVRDLVQKSRDQGLCAEDIDITYESERVQEAVLTSTDKFALEYVTRMTDEVLDLINEKELPKETAHAFLIILSVLKDTHNVK